VCIPSINVDDLGSIFEEHRICRSLNSGARNIANGTSLDLDQRPRDQLCGGIYGEEERKFVFCSALVGIKSKARFKITNTKKVGFGKLRFIFRQHGFVCII
jgi:hydrocephalus-inducing protein